MDAAVAGTTPTTTPAVSGTPASTVDAAATVDMDTVVMDLTDTAAKPEPVPEADVVDLTTAPPAAGPPAAGPPAALAKRKRCVEDIERESKCAKMIVGDGYFDGMTVMMTTFVPLRKEMQSFVLENCTEEEYELLLAFACDNNGLHCCSSDKCTMRLDNLIMNDWELKLVRGILERRQAMKPVAHLRKKENSNIIAVNPVIDCMMLTPHFDRIASVLDDDEFWTSSTV